MCLNDSAFKDVVGPNPDKFRLFSTFATFVYSQLQTILPDSFIGDLSDWDHFLTIDLSSPKLPLKTAADFLRNSDFAKLVAESELPTPTHFVEQALSSYKNICVLLLKHKLCSSKFVRRFSIFDEAVVRHGAEEDYSHESGMLCDFFVEGKWISNAVKPLVISEYSSFITQFRSRDVTYAGDWMSFLSGYYEMHCRENLFIVFKLCCLSLPARLAVPPNFTVNIPGLSSDHDEFNSSIKCVQSSLSGIPNVSGLFSNPRTISRIFTLLGRGRALLEDASFSVWGVLPSCSSRRQRFLNKLESRYICTVSEEEKLWASIHASPKCSSSPNPSSSQLPSSRLKFVKPTPFPTRSSEIVTVETTQSACPVLCTPTLSDPRVVTHNPFLPAEPPGETKKLVAKKKKNSGCK